RAREQKDPGGAYQMKAVAAPFDQRATLGLGWPCGFSVYGAGVSFLHGLFPGALAGCEYTCLLGGGVRLRRGAIVLSALQNGSPCRGKRLLWLRCLAYRCSGV